MGAMVFARYGEPDVLPEWRREVLWSAETISDDFSLLADGKLLELRVLGLGLLQDGNLRVGIFPECEEILIGNAGFGGLPLHSESASDFEVGESTNR